MYFPPAGGGGVARPTKLATHLPELGIETHVLAPEDSKWLYRDEEAAIPPEAHVHRAKYLGPRGRLPAEELHGLEGFDRLLRQAALFSRRLLVPDEFVSWALTAIPGISDFHCGGVVVYRNETKMAYLGIRPDVLKKPGPVSPDVAELMAVMVLEKTPEADLAVSVTGHLGPNAPATKRGIPVAFAAASAASRAIRAAAIFKSRTRCSAP